MDSVVRGLVVYFLLLIVFRVSGNRTLAQMTNFDLVLLLIISETTQQAMVNGDHSITNSILLIITLVGTSIALSYVKQWLPSWEKWIDGVPVVIIENGNLHHDRMRKIRVDEADILEAAREQAGLERMEQIKYAVVERGGMITVVPRRDTLRA